MNIESRIDADENVCEMLEHLPFTTEEGIGDRAKI